MELNVDLPDHVRQAVADIAAARADVAGRQAQLAEKSAATARQLVAKGLTVRDAGTLLGVSFQRAQQLATQGK